ncbi:hypothetical protein FIBSPDRAFT_1051169 [Athelia psychrophila]|uniref:Uncharacterized protein n=1 Tax=Athelia psychrophila TaxID=1759441 RepID=A0A165ZJV1_9AGAM|nr:hypothetical protein FIBSPDRAFT_1051169 [Fibularhizoctonia sp. CBS 109695]
MLASVFILATIASTAVASIQAPSLVYINALPPSGGSGDYEFHLTNTKDWKSLPSDIGSFGFNNDGDRVGWRLKGDNSSALVFNLASGVASNIAEVSYNYTENDISMDFAISGSVSTTFRGSSGSKKRSAWSGSYGNTTLPFNSTVTVDNIECKGDLTFTVVVTTGSSPDKTYTGVNHVNLPITTLPANVTITNAEHSGASLTLYYYDNHPLAITTGGGSSAPSYGAVITGAVQFCSD